MNTTVAFSSEPSWSRRCSTETIFSIQGQETDFVRDTSDTEWCSDERGVEYEPVTEPEGEDAVFGDTSGQSENEIISTKVVEVSVLDDGSLQLADSECTASSSDSELDLHDYWLCATCRAANNTPLYRYCEKCFRIRKNFFPPRPKPKRKRKRSIEPADPQPVFSQDSGVESLAHSQGSEPAPQRAGGAAGAGAGRRGDSSTDCETDSDSDSDSDGDGETPASIAGDRRKEVSRKHTSPRSRPKRKRKPSTELDSQDTGLGDSRATGAGAPAAPAAPAKRARLDYRTDGDCGPAVQPLVKTHSDPALTVHPAGEVTPSADGRDSQDTCIICTTEPKSGVFVHGRVAHICCCYRCALEVWRKARRCPVCNCKVSNVLRAVVM